MVTELGHYMLSEKIIVYHNTRELIKKEDMDFMDALLPDGHGVALCMAPLQGHVLP